MKWLGVTSNIAQIIVTIIAIVAFYYAYSQYTLYLKEISRKPELVLDIFYEEIPEVSRFEEIPTLRGFEYSNSSEYSMPVKLFVSLGNVGDMTAKEVFLNLLFNSNLRILHIDNKRSRMQLPSPEVQIFQYFGENISLPPHFGPIPILFFTASLRKVEGKKVPIGGYFVQSGGQKHKAHNLFYDSDKRDFISEPVQLEGKPGDIIKNPLPNPAPLRLEK